MKWLVVLLVACSGTRENESPPEAVPPPPLTASCPATHDAVGPACVPRFDACAGDALPKLGGGCETIGAPASPTAPSCAEGQMALPGEACAPVAPCATPPAEATFVDASYAGPSDGTKTKPYSTIGAALAVATGTVWIGDGLYREDLVVDKAIRLIGACPAKVTIEGVAVSAAIEVRAAATIESLAIKGPRRAITVDGAKKVTLARLHIHDVGDLGIGARNDAELTVERVLIERAVQAGFGSAGGSATLRAIVVRDVTRGSGTLNGDGIFGGGNPTTKTAGTLSSTGAVVEKTAGGGIAT